MSAKRGAPRQGEQVRVRVNRSFSCELLNALEQLTDNQSEFIEEWMWEHPMLQRSRPVRKSGYIEIRLTDEQLGLQEEINQKCKGVWFPTPRDPDDKNVIGVSDETDTAILDAMGVEYSFK
jgi:hypothetical protein